MVVKLTQEQADYLESFRNDKNLFYASITYHDYFGNSQRKTFYGASVNIVKNKIAEFQKIQALDVPEEEKYLNTEAEIHDMLVGYLGGRAAEEIVFDTVTTGASNDIEQATGLARSMVTRFGMSKKFGLIGLESVESQYLDGRAVLNCSDATAAEIDQEVMKILKAAYDQALALLADNRDCLDKIAAFLIERETITGKEFMKIYRKEKGLPEPEEKKDKKDDTEKTGFAAKLEAEAEAEKKTVEKHVTVIKAPDTDPASEMKNDTEPAPEAEKAALEAGDAVKEPEQKQERTEDTNSES